MAEEHALGGAGGAGRINQRGNFTVMRFYRGYRVFLPHFLNCGHAVFTAAVDNKNFLKGFYFVNPADYLIVYVLIDDKQDLKSAVFDDIAPGALQFFFIHRNEPGASAISGER